MSTEQERAKLLPCPFCGGSVSFHQDDEECRDGCHYIECKTCGTFDLSTAADPTNTVEDLGELRARIAPLWNRRAALQSQEYTAAIGGAGQAYLDRFKNAHALPAEFRWSELWAVMCVAANKGRTDATQSQDRETCSWPYDESDGAHQTSCGNMHIIIDGTPQDNGMKYCCYCGGRITPASDDSHHIEGDGK